MQFSSFLLFAISAVSIARCAPALDAATLSDNAKKAQELNNKFANLKATDPCQGEETACLNGDIATCVDGKFDTSKGKCPQSQQCFAIPDVRASGTSLVCTSESTVIGLMNAAGVNGGIAGSDNSTSPSSSIPSSSSTTTSLSTVKTGSPNDDDPPEQRTVTVTVFASSVSTTTTTTLSPSDASSIISKLEANSQPPPSSTSSSSVPGLTPAAEPGSTPPASPSESSVSSSGTRSVILLTPGGDPTIPTPSPSTDTSPPARVIQLTAMPEVPSPGGPTPTPSPKAVPVGGGGGGYDY